MRLFKLPLRATGRDLYRVRHAVAGTGAITGSRESFCNLLGISRSTYTKYEADQTRKLPTQLNNSLHYIYGVHCGK